MRITAYCGEAKVIVYPPIFYSVEPKLVFKGRLTWKVADTLQMYLYSYRNYNVNHHSIVTLYHIYSIIHKERHSLALSYGGFRTCRTEVKFTLSKALTIRPQVTAIVTNNSLISCNVLHFVGHNVKLVGQH